MPVAGLFVGDAEVAVERIDEPVPVLQDERLVEPVLHQPQVDLSLRQPRILEDLYGEVARVVVQARQEERDQGHHEEDEDPLHQPRQQVAHISGYQPAQNGRRREPGGAARCHPAGAAGTAPVMLTGVVVRNGWWQATTCPSLT